MQEAMPQQNDVEKELHDSREKNCGQMCTADRMRTQVWHGWACASESEPTILTFSKEEEEDTYVVLLTITERMIHTEQRAGGFDAAASVESARMHLVGNPTGACTGAGGLPHPSMRSQRFNKPHLPGKGQKIPQPNKPQGVSSFFQWNG
jgi:hypothetical protein